MRISLITITYRDGALLRRAIDSVYAQRLDRDTHVEHIIVAADDADAQTEEILAYAASRGSKIIRSKAAGCYNALNIGCNAASGDIIGMVHGSDMLAGDNVLASVAEAFTTYRPDFTYADIVYIRNNRPGEVLREYRADLFNPGLLSKGIAPPHPSLYMTRATWLKAGPYKENYRIGADFDFFIRLFRGGFVGRYLPLTTVAMEWGGLSTTFYNRLVVNSIEKRRALRENGYRASMARILLRYFYHPIKKV